MFAPTQTHSGNNTRHSDSANANLDVTETNYQLRIIIVPYVTRVLPAPSAPSPAFATPGCTSTPVSGSHTSRCCWCRQSCCCCCCFCCCCCCCRCRRRCWWCCGGGRGGAGGQGVVPWSGGHACAAPAPPCARACTRPTRTPGWRGGRWRGDYYRKGGRHRCAYGRWRYQNRGR